MTAQSVLDQFSVAYKGIVPATQVLLLNRADILIERKLKRRRKDIYVALTENDWGIDLDAGVVWIDECRYLDAPATTLGSTAGSKLTETSQDELSEEDGDWRANGPDSPCKFYRSADQVGGRIEFDCPLEASTLTVSAATNASPIAVTSSAAHGLSDGDRVDIRNALGNTAANGQWYANVTGTTTFELYEDEDLTEASTGNGVYTSGGLINCEGSPMLKLYTVWHEALTSGSNMPDDNGITDLYAACMKWLWASDRHLDERDTHKQTFEDMIAEHAVLVGGRAGRKQPQINIVKQRPIGHVERTRW